MSTVVYIAGQKGGTTKTTTAHLFCLGAIFRKEPAAYVLTDPHRSIKSDGRPYGVLDGRTGDGLAQIIAASHSITNGWLVVDGGGNRHAFDAALSAEADVVILPFRDSEEDIEAIGRDLMAIPNAIALPSAWPTNAKAQQAAQKFIDALDLAFPGRVIKTPLYFVHSVLELLGSSLENPSSTTRNAARRAFDTITDDLALRKNSSQQTSIAA
jgi:hypothetical protein